MARLLSLLLFVLALTGCPDATLSSTTGSAQGAPADGDRATVAVVPATPAGDRVTGGPNPPAFVQRVTGGPNPPAFVQRVTGGPNPPARLLDPPWEVREVARFDRPWAMTFLPDGRLLVTEKTGRLWLLDVATGQRGEVMGVPPVAYGGQGGLGDVVLHPQFATNSLVYLSYAEAGGGDIRGAAVVRGKLLLEGAGGSLTQQRLIWRQVPKVTGVGHYSHRLGFDRQGKLWISSGERQKFTPAQDMQSNLGKMIRLNDDGSIPADNPFVALGGVAAQVWSLGHRNVLGLAFDEQGRLWTHEMGPAGGDELNLIERGANYGWPIVSNGSHYDGTDIPDHATRPEFNAPEAWWTPVIAPAGMVIYTGAQYPQFHGDAFIGGLKSMALIRIEFDGVTAREAQRYPMGQRIREVEQGPDGALWLLEDGVDARLLKLQAIPR